MQEEFLQRYIGNIGNTIGNATRSYLDTYIGCTLKTAEWLWCKALQRPNVSARLRELYHLKYNDKDIDIETSKIIYQDTDLTNKIQAIKEYNKIKWRVATKVELGYDEATKSFLDNIRNNPEP